MPKNGAGRLLARLRREHAPSSKQVFGAFTQRKIDRMKRLATGLLLLALCPQGFSWGHEGHRIVADIAETRLNSAARASPRRPFWRTVFRQEPKISA
jgi:hypothetical protein